MGEVVDLYVCSICGITSETHKHWGPICKKTGRRVCDCCCYECEYHVGWSGIWSCNYITTEEKRQQSLRRSRARFDEENRRVSKAVRSKWREEARTRAIKEARRRTGAARRGA